MNKSGWLKKQFIGVDFSGSARAGKLIWIANGVYENGGLKISDCRAGNIWGQVLMRIPAASGHPFRPYPAT